MNAVMSASERPELSIVVPAYNEEGRLGESLEAALAYLGSAGLEYEILVADDGSADRTAEVAESFAGRRVRLLRLPRNRGKGAATKRGVLASRGELVLLSDADFSTPIEELEKLRSRLGEAELVIGSRSVEGADVRRHQPFYRELMGKTFNKIIRLLGVGGLNDTQCGFKLLVGEVARELFAELVTPGFAYDVELVWLARRRGYRVVEQGVVWINSPDSRVHPLFDPPRMILEILAFRYKHRLRSTRSGNPSSDLPGR